MLCKNCGKKLLKEDRFCAQCGTPVKPGEYQSKGNAQIAPEADYSHYLPIGGWLLVIIGVIVGIWIVSKAQDGFGGLNTGVLLMGIGVITAMVIYAMPYFGLHKVILKVMRIEQALGISTYKEAQAEKTSDSVQMELEGTKSPEKSTA